MNPFVFLSENVVHVTCGKACDGMKIVNPIGSNSSDVWITFCICCAIVIVALISAFVIIYWMNNKETNGNNDNNTVSQDKYYKQRSDLIERKMQILKDLCNNKNELINDNVTKYTDAINYELKILNKQLHIEDSTPEKEVKKSAETKNE